jgi:hypothetical protein
MSNLNDTDPLHNENSDWKDVLSVSLQPIDIRKGTIKLVDHSRILADVPHGLKHPVIPLPHTVEDLVKWMKENIKES